MNAKTSASLVFPIIACLVLLTSPALAITDYTGWWWEGPEKSGTGISIEDQGDTIYLAWYGYDESGRPVWYSSLMTRQESQYAGYLARYTGWPLENDNPGDGYQGTSLGNATIQFQDTAHAAFTYNDGATVYSKTLSRYWSEDADPRLLHGWWYDPDYEGMGLFMEARNGQLFVSWYNYRADRSPRWWITVGNFPAESIHFNGAWQEYSSGQTLTGAFQPAEFNSEKGAVELDFLNESRIDMQWQGTTYNLQRFVFDSEEMPRFLDSRHAQYPMMIVLRKEAIVVGENFDRAAFYNDKGKGFWSKLENGQLGARTTSYCNDYVVMGESTTGARANLAVIDPGGSYTSYMNIPLNPGYVGIAPTRQVTSGNVNSLNDVSAAIGSTSCLLASVIDLETAPEALQVIASACSSNLLPKVGVTTAAEDYMPAPTVLNVAACGPDSTGKSCSEPLALDAEATGAQYDDFATAHAGVIAKAQAEISGAGCLETISLSGKRNGSWTPNCESTHRNNSYAKFYSFTAHLDADVTIDLSSSVDSYLYLLSGSGTDGEVIAANDDSASGKNSRIHKSLEPGSYTIEATTYPSNTTGDFVLEVDGFYPMYSFSSYAVDFDWGCDGSSGSANWKLYQDNTFKTDDVYSGTWSKSDDEVTLTYAEGGQAVYTGQYVDMGMSGTMIDKDGNTGCWEATILLLR